MEKMYEEGGLATDGMDVDPVSGNDIPTGSNAEDVRDDVDAKLSSGEYVVPADVVKYLGVAQLEKLVDKAKMGLEDMEANGRIGGAPVDEPEEVVMTLGGDLGTLDGYATGGMVPGTDIDGIINRVKGAAMKDPSIMNMLKAKGIFIDAGQPAQATPPAVEGQNKAPAAFAEGGTVGPLTGGYNPTGTTSSFNPYAYTPGFSAETDVTGNAPTAGGVYGGSAPTTPTCPPGSTWDAAQNMCVPDAPAAPAPVERSSDGGGGSATPAANPNAWMEKFDYSNPETLFENTMSTIGGGSEEDKPKGLLGGALDMAKGVFAGGIIGKFIATNNAAQAAANSIVLRDMGRGDLADKIDAQYGSYVKSSGIEMVPEAWRDGDRLAASVMEDRKSVLDGWGASRASRASVGGQTGLGARKPAQSAAEATAAYTASNERSRSDRGGSTMDESIAAAQQSRKDATKKKEAASVAASESKQGLGADKAGGRTRTDKKTGKKEETYSSKISRGGGFSEGGLVSPTPKAKSTPAKKTTNKKGLGRK